MTNAATSKIEGTGLGMSIVKNLVDRMEGQIRAESQEGEGSTFYVTLPFKVALQEREELNLPKGQQILVAESMESRLPPILEYLKDGGLVPVHMKRGLDVVTWLTEEQYENRMPCAMLLGQELDDMAVLELATHVRHLAGQDFPILLVSESDWAQMEYQATRTGINAFVPCPLFKSRLLETISGLINQEDMEDDPYASPDMDYSQYRVLLVEDVELNQEI